jgi:quercetin dioxygenase-like cupin family protein
MPLRSGSFGLLFRAALALLFATIAAGSTAVRMEARTRDPGGRAHNPGLTGWCETPVADRKEEGGCYTTAILNVGVLPRAPIYWHLDRFPTRAAAEANRGDRSIMVDSLNRHWLFTIAEQNWRPAAGERIAMIGPLVIDANTQYTARYLETVIPAGFQQPGEPGHRHPGPEAWYVLEGGQCLETPNGVLIAHAGETMLAPDGWPMTIASLGTETRRAVVLVLHRVDRKAESGGLGIAHH